MNRTAYASCLSHRSHMRLLFAAIAALLWFGPVWFLPIPDAPAQPPSAGTSGDDLQVEVTKKGLGKEVVIHKGTREWYMLVEVAEGNTVIIRQEKDGDTYLLDESEMHDRALSKGEIDDIIEAFINSTKNRAKGKQ